MSVSMTFFLAVFFSTVAKITQEKELFEVDFNIFAHNLIRWLKKKKKESNAIIFVDFCQLWHAFHEYFHTKMKHPLRLVYTFCMSLIPIEA